MPQQRIDAITEMRELVTFMLGLNGFEVTDLGVDVPPERFVEAVKKTGA